MPFEGAVSGPVLSSRQKPEAPSATHQSVNRCSAGRVWHNRFYHSSRAKHLLISHLHARCKRAGYAH